MNKYKVIRIAFVLVAIVLIGIGLFTRDYAGVFRKASRICYECIGIG